MMLGLVFTVQAFSPGLVVIDQNQLAGPSKQIKLHTQWESGHETFVII